MLCKISRLNEFDTSKNVPSKASILNGIAQILDASSYLNIEIIHNRISTNILRFIIFHHF